jgi:hypothetical protein
MASPLLFLLRTADEPIICQSERLGRRRTREQRERTRRGRREFRGGLTVLIAVYLYSEETSHEMIMINDEVTAFLAQVCRAPISTSSSTRLCCYFPQLIDPPKRKIGRGNKPLCGCSARWANASSERAIIQTDSEHRFTSSYIAQTFISGTTRVKSNPKLTTGRTLEEASPARTGSRRESHFKRSMGMGERGGRVQR